jgi:tetraacyldisaccharide 4'-kinase
VKVWVIQRTLSFDGDGRLPNEPLAFCGIARPENFLSMLRGAGYEPTDVVTFEDHHRYTEESVRTLLERARKAGANGFCTTEKDAVKLTPPLLERLEAVGPVVVARLGVELVDEKEAMFELVSMVGEMDRRRTRR